jgi:DNA polymerase/3'-5' exonuclease PolX
MSATQTRLPRAQAVELAWELVALLSPYCERIEVLGSIRRERPTCGDVELLAIPKVDAPVAQDLFGNPVLAKPMNALHLMLDALMFDRTLLIREPKRWGDRYRAALYKGFPVDLFICLPPAQFGVLKVIRTGSDAFSKRLVTPVERGGRMPKGMYCRNGALWVIGERGQAEPGPSTETDWMLQTPEEIDVFSALRMAYVAPELREV